MFITKKKLKQVILETRRENANETQWLLNKIKTIEYIAFTDKDFVIRDIEGWIHDSRMYERLPKEKNDFQREKMRGRISVKNLTELGFEYQGTAGNHEVWVRDSKKTVKEA